MAVVIDHIKCRSDLMRKSEGSFFHAETGATLPRLAAAASRSWTEGFGRSQKESVSVVKRIYEACFGKDAVAPQRI